MNLTNLKRFFLLIVLSLTINVNSIFSNDIKNTSFNLVSQVEQQLLVNEFLPERHSQGVLGGFQENILISFEKEDSLKDDFQIDSVIFAFTQEFFVQHQDFVLDFLSFIKVSALPYNTFVLFSCDSDNSLLKQQTICPSATEYFIENLQETENICAFAITDENELGSYIISGGKNKVSPQWIVQNAVSAFSKAGKNVELPGFAILLYQSGLYKENKRVSSFLNHEIPCVGIPSSGDNKDFIVLTTILENLSNFRPSTWNNHYDYIHLFNFGFWLNESIYTLIYICFIFFVLASLCFSSFSNSGKNSARLLDLGRTWYLIPALIFAFTILLFIFQWMFYFKRNSTFFYFGHILIYSTASLMTLIVLQIRYKFKISYEGACYQMLIISAFNIFLFTSIDLSMMFIFFVEYLLVYFFNRTKNPVVNIFFMFTMIAPFYVLLENIYIFSDVLNLKTSFSNSLLLNLLLSFSLYPILVQWMKIILTLNIFESKNKFLLHSILTVLVSILILLGIYLSLIGFIKFNLSRKNLNKNIQTEKIINELSKDLFKVTDSELKRIQLKQKTIDIKSDEIPLRYEVIIFSENNKSILDSTFDYELDKNNYAVLKIPDFPPQNLVFDYMCEPEDIFSVQIIGYFLGSDGKIYSQKKVIN